MLVNVCDRPSGRFSAEQVAPIAGPATGSGVRGQGLDDLFGAGGGGGGFDVGGADERVPVEVVEQFGDALLAEPGGVLADPVVRPGQAQALARLVVGLLARPYDAPDDDADRVGVLAGLLGGAPDGR